MDLTSELMCLIVTRQEKKDGHVLLEIYQVYFAALSAVHVSIASVQQVARYVLYELLPLSALSSQNAVTLDEAT